MENDNVHAEDLAAPKELSRRTIVRGAAWTIPVVAVAAAAPAAAASGPAKAPPASTGTTWAQVFYGFNDLDSSDRWRSSSTGTVRVFAYPNRPIMGRSTDVTGANFVLHDAYTEFTFPWQVTGWNAPSGWTVTHQSGTTYRFTPPASAFGVARNMNTPYSAWGPSGVTLPTFRGTPVISNGTRIPSSINTPFVTYTSRTSNFAGASGGPYSPTTVSAASTANVTIAAEIDINWVPN